MFVHSEQCGGTKDVYKRLSRWDAITVSVSGLTHLCGTRVTIYSYYDPNVLKDERCSTANNNNNKRPN